MRQLNLLVRRPGFKNAWTKVRPWTRRISIHRKTREHRRRSLDRSGLQGCLNPTEEEEEEEGLQPPVLPEVPAYKK